jgi:replicative DNA helicase
MNTPAEHGMLNTLNTLACPTRHAINAEPLHKIIVNKHCSRQIFKLNASYFQSAGDEDAALTCTGAPNDDSTVFGLFCDIIPHSIMIQ